MSVSYPYQRIALPCGCHEVVTGPGAIDCYSCEEHAGREDGGPLLEARIDAFEVAYRRAAEEGYFRLPNYCWDCGVVLQGGATRHKQGCSLLALIESAFPKAEKVQ